MRLGTIRVLMSDVLGLSDDRRQLLLGGIVDAFSSMELRGQVLLAGFALQELVGEILAADLNFIAIVQKLTLLSKLPGLGTAGDELNGWARRAKAASERRNGVVHSLWYLQDLDDRESGARFKLSARGRATNAHDVFRINPESEEELEDLTRDLNELVLEAATLAEALRATGKWQGASIT